MGPRKLPLVYLDTCCFGVVAQKRTDVDAQRALLALLAQFEFLQLRYCGSTWLEIELAKAQPRSKARRLSSLVPREDLHVPLTPKVKRLAIQLRAKLKDADESALPDCRHLASAIVGGADFVVTYDARFFEFMRQCGTMIKPVKPVWLIGWQEVVFRRY